jgi:hypothetical protein
VVACGGGGGSDTPDARVVVTADADPGQPDAAPDVPDAGVSLACNPVAQTGCAAGEKCGYLVESDDPFLARTTCLPDGTVPEGGDCVRGEAGATGFDDCVAGFHCRSGICAEICTINPDSCPVGAALCQRYNQTFEDDPNGNIGVCDPTCDVFDPASCPMGQACYFNVFSGGASCANIAGDEGQNVACSFLNSCSPGLSCVIVDAETLMTELQCATMCNLADGTGPQTCAIVPEIANGAPTCAELVAYWGDPALPPGIGACIDCALGMNPKLDVCAVSP